MGRLGVLVLFVALVSSVHGQRCPKSEEFHEEKCKRAAKENLGENERVLLDTWSQENLKWPSDTGTVITYITYLFLE